MAIEITHSPDLIIIDRTIVTILDVLAAIGGLESMLTGSFSLLLVVLNHNSLSNFLSARLFKLADDADPQK